MEKQKGLVEVSAERAWKFLSSVKLAVVLLIILAIVSIVGTVIEQNQPVEKYLEEYSRGTVAVLDFLGFFDMYRTLWFLFLLFLLTANLTVCTLDRFPKTWSIIKAPLRPIEEEALKAVPFKKEITVQGGIDGAKKRTAEVLRSGRYRYLESSTAESTQFYMQKGVYSRLGVYITHVSVILIFVGALIGGVFGFKGYLRLDEGTQSQMVMVRNAPKWDAIVSSLGLRESRVKINPATGEKTLPLGFYLKCLDFEVDYYQDPRTQGPMGMPKEFYSILSVLDESGRPLIDQLRIEVNDPLTYRGITFYQSNYGVVSGVRGAILLHIRQKSGRSMVETILIEPGSETYVPSIDRRIKVVGVALFGARDPSTGQVMYYRPRNNEFINPTVELEVYKGRKGKTPLYRTQVMKMDIMAPYMPEEYSIEYLDYWGVRYTGLQVTKDPGVWVVYVGFILLCIGPLIAFFGSHRKLWVRIQDKKGRALVTVAGSSNRNRLAFEREFNRIVDEISRQDERRG